MFITNIIIGAAEYWYLFSTLTQKVRTYINISFLKEGKLGVLIF